MTPITLAPHIGTDKVRVIGISAPNRHPLVPDAPTIAELGLPQATVTVWYGLMGPAKLPAAVTDRLRMAVEAAMKGREFKEKLEKAGVQIAYAYGADFQKAVVAEFNEWKAIGAAEKIVLE